MNILELNITWVWGYNGKHSQENQLQPLPSSSTWAKIFSHGYSWEHNDSLCEEEASRLYTLSKFGTPCSHYLHEIKECFLLLMVVPSFFTSFLFRTQRSWASMSSICWSRGLDWVWQRQTVGLETSRSISYVSDLNKEQISQYLQGQEKERFDVYCC